MPIASYEPIPCDFPVVTADDLSSDQQYLLDICHAVITGQCSFSLSHRQPGQLVMSRWVTLANRVLRFYIATEKPSANLKTIAVLYSRSICAHVVHYQVKTVLQGWFQTSVDADEPVSLLTR